jgi:hypothetical protein
MDLEERNAEERWIVGWKVGVKYVLVLSVVDGVAGSPTSFFTWVAGDTTTREKHGNGLVLAAEPKVKHGQFQGVCISFLGRCCSIGIITLLYWGSCLGSCMPKSGSAMNTYAQRNHPNSM